MGKRNFTAPDIKDAVEEMVGPYRLAFVYRRIAGDEGPTIHVFGPVEGEDKEIIRFDCFQNQPHIHFGISHLDEPVQKIESSDPFEWVLTELAERFPECLTRSQVNCELPDDWQVSVGRTCQKFRASKSSVTH